MSRKNDKWSMFKNYMTNELHITKDDIRQWIQEAVEQEAINVVNNSFSSCNLESRIDSLISKNFYAISDTIAKKVASKLSITIK